MQLKISSEHKDIIMYFHTGFSDLVPFRKVSLEFFKHFDKDNEVLDEERMFKQGDRMKLVNLSCCIDAPQVYGAMFAVVDPGCTEQELEELLDKLNAEYRRPS